MYHKCVLSSRYCHLQLWWPISAASQNWPWYKSTFLSKLPGMLQSLRLSNHQDSHNIAPKEIIHWGEMRWSHRNFWALRFKLEHCISCSNFWLFWRQELFHFAHIFLYTLFWFFWCSMFVLPQDAWWFVLISHHSLFCEFHLYFTLKLWAFDIYCRRINATGRIAKFFPINLKLK